MATENKPQFVAKEWIGGGSIYAYGTIEQRSFVVSVFLTDDVKGDLLQQATDKALERLPYYRQSAVRKKALYYIAENDLPFEVAESKEPRVLGSAEVNYHYVDVSYFGNKIDFSMAHFFTDGMGLNRFIEAVLYHYFCLKDGKEYDSTGIYTDAVPFDEAETYDPFLTENKADVQELKELANSEERYRLPELGEAGTQGPLMYRLPLKIKTSDFIAWCKSVGASPAAGVSAIMMKAVVNEHKLINGVIMSVLPFTLRRFIGAEKTYKNCNSALFLPTQPSVARDMPVGELAVQLRGKMKEEMNEHLAHLMFSSINMIIHLGKKLPTYFLKSKVFALPERKPQDTFLVDYVGGLTANGYEDQISEVRYLNADAFGGSIGVVMSETAGYFHINITQTFKKDCYYKGFCAVLDELNIPYEMLECDTYLNPVVELPAK